MIWNTALAINFLVMPFQDEQLQYPFERCLSHRMTSREEISKKLLDFQDDTLIQFPFVDR